MINPSLSLSKKFKIISKSSFGKLIPHSLKPKIKSSILTLSLPSYEENCLKTLPLERIDSTPFLFMISLDLFTTNIFINIYIIIKLPSKTLSKSIFIKDFIF